MGRYPILKGKELGESIKALKNYVEHEGLNYQDWLNDTDLDEIFEVFDRINNLSVKN